MPLPPPGGDVIGRRRIDTHFLALEQLGAEITSNEDYHFRASKLRGTDVFLDEPSVTGTENALMAAVLCKGTSRLVNAAREPEIVDLCNLLTAMGAEIEGIGTSELTIHGVRKLHGATYRVMPDRIEAGSYACAAAITGGEVRPEGADAGDTGSPLHACRHIAVESARAPPAAAPTVASRRPRAW